VQSPKTNIGSRMAGTEELIDFQRGTVVGCHLPNKSVCPFISLLELPRSTVSAFTVKWKQQRLSHKVVGQKSSQNGHTSAKAHSVYPRLQQLLQSSKLPLEATSALKLLVRILMKWVSTAEQPRMQA
jgi:hypothetical protein